MAQKSLSTPKGVAVYPWLTGKKDMKFKAEGCWHVKLRLEGDDAQTMKSMVDGYMKESLKVAKEAFAKRQAESPKKSLKPTVMSTPPYIENEDGSIDFSFKMLASGISKKTSQPWTRKPTLFDTKGVPFKTEPKIGGGSIIKIGYQPHLFDMPVANMGHNAAGVSLRLEAVQVLKLVEWGASAATYGFEDESSAEDGAEMHTDGADEAVPAGAEPESDDF